LNSSKTSQRLATLITKVSAPALFNKLIPFSGLIEECHAQCQFLNQLPSSVVDQSMAVFREKLFSMTERKAIPHAIYEILETELIEE
jgi:hypothetical protein